MQRGEVLENAGVYTIRLKNQNGSFRVGLSRGWSEQGNNHWVITAYKDGDGVKPPRTDSRPSYDPKGAEYGTDLTQRGRTDSTTSPLNKDSTPKPEIKFKSPKQEAYFYKVLQRDLSVHKGQDYIPTFSAEIKPEETIAITPASLFKMHFDKYPRIKALFANPDAVFKQEEGYLFVKQTRKPENGHTDKLYDLATLTRQADGRFNLEFKEILEYGPTEPAKIRKAYLNDEVMLYRFTPPSPTKSPTKTKAKGPQPVFVSSAERVQLTKEGYKTEAELVALMQKRHGTQIAQQDGLSIVDDRTPMNADFGIVVGRKYNDARKNYETGWVQDNLESLNEMRGWLKSNPQRSLQTPNAYLRPEVGYIDLVAAPDYGLSRIFTMAKEGKLEGVNDRSIADYIQHALERGQFSKLSPTSVAFDYEPSFNSSGLKLRAIIAYTRPQERGSYRWVLQDFKVIDAKETPKNTPRGGKPPIKKGDLPTKSTLKEDLSPQEIKSHIEGWDLSPKANANHKQRLRVSKIDPIEAQELAKAFKFKGIRDLVREIDAHQVLHALSEHGDEAKEARRGQIAITLEDIAHYQEYIKNPDFKSVQDNGRIVYGKQINGHAVVIEEALIGQDKLRFFDMWKLKGALNEKVLLAHSQRPNTTPSLDLEGRMPSIESDSTTTPLKKQTTAQGKNYLKSLSPEELKKAEDETYQDLSLLATKPLSTTPLTKEQLFKELKGYKHFGHDFTEFRDKGLEALELIAKKKHGQVSGAYYRADLGAIDIGYQLPLSNNTQRGLVDLLAGRGASDTQTNIYYWGKPALAPFAGNTDKEKILRAVDKIIKEGTYSLEEGHHMLNLELDNGIYQLELFPLSLKQPSHFYPMSIQYHHKPKNPNSPMERE
ncbi:hypothetical protein HAL07_05900 [Helicobacter ailurogastricus]|uniref:Phage-Barnase-EndoU-ColicinE5/D-RelE like nuclease 3 domain-containing protein n=1 Tax=Helicobacter ailurogastricus TaxID=1578720 RepID=A0A0K2Y3P7_9HELI|nr:hypothetical protein HAL07_05900 [Helicobacter ailurogastricus]